MQDAPIMIRVPDEFAALFNGIKQATGKTKKRIFEDLLLQEGSRHPALADAVADAQAVQSGRLIS